MARSNPNCDGREIIVYQDEDDPVRTMDAYCPHMGAHLAEDASTVKGFAVSFTIEARGSGEVTDILAR